MRLTDLSIKALKAPEHGATVYPDDTLTGFGVRVSNGGTKSYVLTHGIRRQRETIGRVGVVSLQEARLTARQKLAEYTLGKTQTRSVSWNTALEEYLGEIADKRRESTHAEYRRALSRHFRFGETKIADLTPQDLQGKLNKLRTTPSEQQHAYVYLRAFMKWCFQRSYLDKNPMERMKPPHRYTPRERILTDDELRKVWTALEDDTFSGIVKLLILTGQRVGEISQLTKDMIGEGTITLPPWLTKNGREHNFPIAATASALVSHQAGKSPLLFPARGSSSSSFSGFSKSKTRLDKLSSVENWTLHDLRRTFASGLAALGTPLPVVEKLLNHVSGSFSGVAGVYQRYDFRKEMREAVDKWNDHILALTEPKVVPFQRLRA